MFHSRWSAVFLWIAVLCGTANAQQVAPVTTADKVDTVDRTEPGPKARKLQEDLELIKRQLEELEGITVTGAVPVVERKRGIELGAGIYAYGYLSAAYVWNRADPPARRGTNFGRLNDPDHNSFSLPYAQLGLARDVSGRNELDVGFRAEVGFGRLIERGFTEDGLFDDLPIDLVQAYGQLQLGTPCGQPISVRAGRMAMTWGTETLDLRSNANFSLGYLNAYGPRTVTGVALEVNLADGLRYTQFVANGWDRVDDLNDGKTLGGELVYTGLKDLTVRGHWILGAERADSEGDKRWAVGFDVGYSPRLGTDLRLAGVYGQEEGGDRRDEGLARFGGVSFTAKQGFFLAESGSFHHLSLAGRGEWFRDQGGSRSGESQTLAGVTATIELRPIEPLALRLEYRHDWSSEDVFAGSDRPSARDQQDTFAAELSFSF